MKAMMESARLFQLAGRDFIGAMTRRGDLELVSNAVQQVLGRPPHSIVQWIETNQNAFAK